MVERLHAEGQKLGCPRQRLGPSLLEVRRGVAELEEGSIGILNSNFEKLVNMFREGKRKEAEEKEFLKDVMSDISHQLKTPLASLNIFIDLLLNDKLESEEERKKILREAENQMTRMQWMVLSMLKLARIEATCLFYFLF